MACRAALASIALGTASLVGCLSRGNVDLLESRLRQQQAILMESQREAEKTRGELLLAQREADSLRKQLAQSQGSSPPPEFTAAVHRATNVKIHSMLTSALNKDDAPGDDAIVVQFAPYDDDGEIVKLPGEVVVTAIDPAADSSLREVGTWRFTAEQCRESWTRGFLAAGYQFTLPLSRPPAHEELVLNLRLSTADGRTFEANQLIRVVLPGAAPIAAAPKKDEAVTPAGHTTRRAPEPSTDDRPPVDDRPPIRVETPHSANWTDVDIPKYR